MKEQKIIEEIKLYAEEMNAAGWLRSPGTQ